MFPALAAACAHFDPIAAAPWVGAYSWHSSVVSHLEVGAPWFASRTTLFSDGTLRLAATANEDTEVTTGRWCPADDGVILVLGKRVERAWLVRLDNREYVVSATGAARVCGGGGFYAYEQRSLDGPSSVALPYAEFCARHGDERQGRKKRK